MDTSIAHLFTMTTYGTWLHGDPRGSFDKRGAGQSVFLGGDTARLDAAAGRMLQPPMRFNADLRELVDAVIFEVCRHSGYDPIAVNVRTNHLHAVLGGVVDPHHAANAIKRWSTRRLRESGLVTEDRRVWTRGCNIRQLVGRFAIDDGVTYILERQGDPPVAMPCCFPGTRPLPRTFAESAVFSS